MKHASVKALVKKILEAPPDAYPWTLQGLGMLRTYIGDNARLHVWDSEFRVPDVTMMHDHPWDFESLIIAGEVVQYRFTPARIRQATEYIKRSIVCGPGGNACGEEIPIRLFRHAAERYVEGEHYAQHAHEIHRSEPLDGTVTLIERTFHPDTEHANVYYRELPGWVSAEPRAATPVEVATITAKARERWF